MNEYSAIYRLALLNQKKVVIILMHNNRGFAEAMPEGMHCMLHIRSYYNNTLFCVKLVLLCVFPMVYIYIQPIIRIFFLFHCDNVLHSHKVKMLTN